MTRGQRSAHRIIWMVLAPLAAILLVGAIVLRQGPVSPSAELPSQVEKAP